MLGTVAAIGWTIDAVLHMTLIPHGSPVHGFFAMLTVPAVVFMNAA